MLKILKTNNNREWLNKKLAISPLPSKNIETPKMKSENASKLLTYLLKPLIKKSKKNVTVR